MDLDNNIFEANRQFNDSNYYRILDNPIYNDNIPGIKAILQKMKNEGFISNLSQKYV